MAGEGNTKKDKKDNPDDPYKIYKERKHLCFILIGLIVVIALGAILANQVVTASAEAKAREEAAAKVEQMRTAVMEKAEKLYQGYFYEEAMTLLQENSKLMTNQDDDPMQKKIAEIEKAEKSLVKYEGPVEHVFFHSLIIYPELAFDDKGHPAQGYNMWMTTVQEFEKMLPQFLEKGYVLYSLADYMEADPENPGKIKVKDIYLPPGKIPMVISIDDVNYYNYMKQDGFANRLVLGEDGRVWTEVITPQGETKLTRDGDVMPILDDFVVKHPEFSWRGAKGTMAVTGYEGALGYRITDCLPTEIADQITVKKIADTMRANGWLFACHSYTHNGYFRTGTVTMAQMKADVSEWKQKIEPWVGQTNIYISPFGYSMKNQDPRYRYLIQSGFQIFCPVGNGRMISTYDDNMVMPRVDLDGFTMINRSEELQQHYFNVKDIIDPARPPLEIH